MTAPPLALDIDGTLTRPDAEGIDPRVFDPLGDWPAPIVLATGKAFPYPVALCHFVGIPERVVAENGGIVYVGREITIVGDAEAARKVIEAYRSAGHSIGWEGADTINRWRETEVAVARSQPYEPLAKLAAEHGLEVVDTGYAYHLKDPSVTKGRGLVRAAAALDLDPESFVAIGDSENDASLFEQVGQSFAVANADETAIAAADECLDDAAADGTLSVLDRLG